MLWKCMQPENVARDVRALKKQNPSKSNKVLSKIRQRIDAQPDINSPEYGSLKSFANSNKEDD